MRGRINLLDDLAAFATVSVSLRGAPTPGDGENIATPIEAFQEAIDVSVLVGRHLLNATAVLLVMAIWVLPLTGS